MNSLSVMNGGTDTYVASIKYKSAEIYVEQEVADEDGNAYSGIIYLGRGEWHEFEGTGLFMTPSDVIDICKSIVDRDGL